jgi:peroxiredoxin Q/BCP
LRRDYKQFTKRDTEILSIGPEDEERFQEYWKKERLPFVGLADPEHRVADRYGQAVRLLKLGRMPSQILVDQQGIVRWRHDGSSMRDIPDNREVLSEIDGLSE